MVKLIHEIHLTILNITVVYSLKKHLESLLESCELYQKFNKTIKSFIKGEFNLIYKMTSNFI